MICVSFESPEDGSKLDITSGESLCLCSILPVRFTPLTHTPLHRRALHYHHQIHDMAFNNQFHMPGSFHFEGPGAPTTSTTHLNANMFRPPVSPSTSTYNLSKSTGSLLSDNSMATNSTNPVPRLGRKRTYDESTSRGLSNLKTELPREQHPSPMEDGDAHAHRYTLAGQIETPGAQITPQGGTLEDSLYSDIDYRRALGSKRSHDDGHQQQQPQQQGLQLVHPETGEPVTPRSAGWTTFAFQAIGGVVGKMWEFCRGGAGAFRGFQAGGGKAYEINGQPVPVLLPAGEVTAMRTDEQGQEILGIVAPGAFPASAGLEYIPNYFSDVHRSPTDADDSPNPFAHQSADDSHQAPNPFALQSDSHQAPNLFARQPVQQQEDREPSPETTPERPAAKRRQTGLHSENDELRRNWVMVDEDEPAPSPTATRPPLNRASTPSSSRIPAAAASRLNTASRLQQPRFSTPTAAGRRISIPSPRFSDRSNIPTRASSRLSMASPVPGASYAGFAAGSPTLNAREGASFASPRSPSRGSSNPFPPTGSRLPVPKSGGGGGGLGPNPFANAKTPTTSASPAHPRVVTSRPSSRQSTQHPSPLHANFNSRVPTPGSGHRRHASSNGGSGSVRGSRSGFGFETHQHHQLTPSGGGGEKKPPSQVQVSPRLDDEGRQLATRRFAVQRKQDSRLDRLNAELQGLIRQGQEALGTRFDVDMDMEESWEEAG